MDTALADDLGITILPPVKVVGVPHHRDLPVHTLSCLSTHPMSQYCYLQLHQCTLYPVLPVHTHAEYSKFKLLINNTAFQKGYRNYPAHEAYEGVDFNVLAKFWNAEVNTQD